MKMTTSKKQISFRIDENILSQFRTKAAQGEMSRLVENFMKDYITEGDSISSINVTNPSQKIQEIMDKCVSRHGMVYEHIISKGLEWGVSQDEMLAYVELMGYEIANETNKTWQ